MPLRKYHNMRIIGSISVFILFSLPLLSQDSLLANLEKDPNRTEKITGAFKSTRVINAHSLEMLGKHNLDVRILHRFERVNLGINQFYGLDIASMRLGFDYGISNNLMVGIGRSTFRKEIDGFIKTRLIQQSTGRINNPLTVLLVAGASVWTEESFATVKPGFSDRSAYYVQVIAGRKFNRNFSLQLSPILLQKGMIENPGESQTIFALGGGARYKFNKRCAFTIDYHHPLSGIATDAKDPLSVGLDIETGGHVFQLHFSNAVGMNERAYLTQTTYSFLKGDIRFGFNLSRIFHLGK